jgi:choline dehydrogenase-like flavoprotein
MSANPSGQGPGDLDAEVLILGSGPGGATTACRLAEAGRDVLLVEEGPHLAPDAVPPFTREEMVAKYRNGGLTVGLGRPNVLYVEGRCVGGGSEVNSGLYHRTPSDVLAEWRDGFRIEALREDDLRPHFEAVERDIHVSPLKGPAPPSSLKLHDGATRLGWKSLEVPRWYSYETAPDGKVISTKQTMTRTLVPRALAAGARLLAATRAVRIRRGRDRWEVVVHQESAGGAAQSLTLSAPTIFLACGAIQTPALLLRSRLGRHVGDTLRMHPTIKALARFPEEINGPDMGVPMHQVKEFSPRISLGCSISSPPYLKLAMLDHPDHLAEVDAQWRRMAIYYAMTRGGRGSVRVLPGYRDPLVRYHLDAGDLAELAEGLRVLGRCLFAAGVEVLYPSIAGSVPVRSEADLDTIADRLPPDRTNLMTIHLFSSCPIGEDRTKCVADSFGRVHDTSGLYIADASLLPGPPGVNPQGSVMAVASRNAEHFLATPRRPRVRPPTLVS